ncbi:hypothetical protein 162322522 [Organic Lake phycodnavirus 1]|jgi:putative cell wall-binding protein|nr:hypothetical protein 162322522 [Organic Lake phycodnavirus 1]
MSLVTISRTKYIEDISSLILADISDNIELEFREGNPEFISLANLREYKNREGVNIYDDIYFRTRVGRTNGRNISFEQYDYKTRQMRRKAEILQYKNNQLPLSEKNTYKNSVTSKSRFSQATLKMIRDTQNIESCQTQKGHCSDIVYDQNIPFETSL